MKHKKEQKKRTHSHTYKGPKRHPVNTNSDAALHMYSLVSVGCLQSIKYGMMFDILEHGVGASPQFCCPRVFVQCYADLTLSPTLLPGKLAHGTLVALLY